MSDNENASVAEVNTDTEMIGDVTAAQTTKSSGSKWSVIIVVILLVAAIGGGIWFYLAGEKFGSPVKQVGSIDRDAIYALDEFKKAETDIKAFSETKQKEFDAAVKEKGGKQGADVELQNLARKLELEVGQKKNQILLPLQTRAEAAVASVARSKGLTVVLDKRIVVYGIPDITEDVKKIFQQKGELKLPAGSGTFDDSPVAYFNQEGVRMYKAFAEADIQLQNTRNELMREYEQKAPKLSPAEQELLKRRMSARLDTVSEAIITPLNQKVVAAVNKVAKEQNISLVLDKQNVMYGGRDITSAVMDTFISSLDTGAAGSQAAGAAGSTTSEPATEAASPAASAK